MSMQSSLKSALTGEILSSREFSVLLKMTTLLQSFILFAIIKMSLLFLWLKVNIKERLVAIYLSIGTKMQTVTHVIRMLSSFGRIFFKLHKH